MILSAENVLEYLTAEDRALLVEKGSLIHFAEGDIIIQEGQQKAGVYIILKGHVLVSHKLQGNRIILKVLQKGQIFGELSFILDDNTTANVIAKDECHLINIEAKKLMGLLQSMPGFANRFYNSLTSNLSKHIFNLSQEYSALYNNFMSYLSLDAPVKMREPICHMDENIFQQTLAIRDKLNMLIDGLWGKEIISENIDELNDILSQLKRSINDLIGNEGKEDNKTEKLNLVQHFSYYFHHYFQFSKFYIPNNIVDKNKIFAQKVICSIVEGNTKSKNNLSDTMNKWILDLNLLQSFKNNINRTNNIISDYVLKKKFLSPIPIATFSTCSIFPISRLVKAHEASIINLTYFCASNNELNNSVQFFGDISFDKASIFIDDILRTPLPNNTPIYPKQEIIIYRNMFENLSDKEIIKIFNWAYMHLSNGGKFIFNYVNKNSIDLALINVFFTNDLKGRTVKELKFLILQSKFIHSNIDIHSLINDGEILVSCNKA